MTPTSAGCTLEMVLALDLSLTDAEGCQPSRDTRPSEKYLVLPTKVVLDGGKSLLVYETLNGNYGRGYFGVENRLRNGGKNKSVRYWGNSSGKRGVSEGLEDAWGRSRCLLIKGLRLEGGRHLLRGV